MSHGSMRSPRALQACGFEADLTFRRHDDVDRSQIAVHLGASPSARLAIGAATHRNSASERGAAQLTVSEPLLSPRCSWRRLRSTASVCRVGGVAAILHGVADGHQRRRHVPVA